MWNWVMPKVPGWKALRHLGASRTLKTSYWWMVLVPLVAKTAGQLPVRFVVLDAAITFPIDLPFSWPFFYFASVSFAAASFLFSWRCPSLISKYSDGQDFFTRGGHSSELRNQMRCYMNEVPSCADLKINDSTQAERTAQFRSLIETHMHKPPGETPAGSRFDTWHFMGGAIMDAYADATLAFDQTRITARAACVVMYSIGFLGLLIVLCQNVAFVANASGWFR